MTIIPINLNYLIINTSLDKKSKTRCLATSVFERFSDSEQNVEFVDLFDYNLPFCDGDTTYGHESVNLLTQKLRAALGIIICAPIYNYDINAAGKNLIELTSHFWKLKVVGFACHTGEQKTSNPVLPVANSLLFDHHCVIVPKMVTANREDITDGKIVNPKINAEIDALSKTLLHFTTSLAPHLSLLSFG